MIVKHKKKTLCISLPRGLGPPSVRPNHLAAPGDGAPRGTCLRPGAKVLGSQTDLLNPWYEGRAEIVPFQYLPVLLGGKGTSHVGWDTGDLPSQGEKPRASNPTRPILSPQRNACGASVPPHPLRVARSQSRGLASSSPCGVVATVAPVPTRCV